MSIQCEILKSFPFSEDGVTIRTAAPGPDSVGIPDGLVPGLTREGYVRPATVGLEAKAVAAAPEHQAFDGAPENKAIESAPENKGVEAVPEVGAADPYPHLSPAQEKALDRDRDGKPGGSRKSGRPRGRPKKA